MTAEQSLIFPLLVIIGMGLAVLCDQWAAYDEHARWEATFAPAHPDHPKGY